MKISKPKTWQQSMQSAITDPMELIAELGLDPSMIEPAKQAAKLFPLRVTREFMACMEYGNVNDPLLKQILPLGCETVVTPGYTADPLNELASNPLPGLLHKYYGRALVTMTGVCGINCRFCFRREFPYKKNNPGSTGWENILNYIKNDKTISEIILSGGDPLMMDDKTLADRIQQLNQINHLKRIRIHTRMPIILPSRICDALMDWIMLPKLKIIIVVHCNHPNEINQDVKIAMQKLKSIGVTLLNQSVLLKGVNDSAEILIALSEKLFSADILPYYLHVLDRVQGTAHFDVPREIAIQLHRAMQQKLPGFLVPKLVTEIAGEKSKMIISGT